jgi:hypothetical protein
LREQEPVEDSQEEGGDREDKDDGGSEEREERPAAAAEMPSFCGAFVGTDSRGVERDDKG